MKKHIVRLFILLCFLVICTVLVAQVEIKGTGTTGSTKTLITRNAANDTSMVVRDDGRIGMGVSDPMSKLDVNGVINARSGVRYPDGMTQTIAYTGPPVPVANRFVVASSGGDFPTISAAIAACVAPGPTNPYLIEVMPGNYPELVTCVEFVSLRGAGKYAARILGTVIAADSIVIEGFEITQGIQCPGVSPFILHNLISNTLGGGNGITVMGPAMPWIKENEISACPGWGIFCNPLNSNPWIIANKIINNSGGGIRIDQSSPTISNNIIDDNNMYGIYILGGGAAQSDPVITDNVISNTGFPVAGPGIWMAGLGEPKIISNDIFMNEVGIQINPATQPSVTGNNINYNLGGGIRCYSNGNTKRVVITGNHINSNISILLGPPPLSAGIWVQNCNPMITLNNITLNNVPPLVGFPDIDYSTCITFFPTISSNIYDMINRPGGGPGPGPAGGMYNTTAMGLPINP